MGGGKAGSVDRSCAVNLTLIVIYKGKVRRTWRATGFMHVNISVLRYFSSGMKAAQTFIHEAPGICLREGWTLSLCVCVCWTDVVVLPVRVRQGGLIKTLARQNNTSFDRTAHAQRPSFDPLIVSSSLAL